jgi:hypothetical protein
VEPNKHAEEQALAGLIRCEIMIPDYIIQGSDFRVCAMTTGFEKLGQKDNLGKFNCQTTTVKLSSGVTASQPGRSLHAPASVTVEHGRNIVAVVAARHLDLDWS